MVPVAIPRLCEAGDHRIQLNVYNARFSGIELPEDERVSVIKR